MRKHLFVLLFITCNFLLATCNLFSQQPTQEWVQRYSGLQNYGSAGFSVRSDTLGNVYVLSGSATDTSFADIILLKYSPLGDLMWSAVYNSPGNLSEQGNVFAVTPTGDVYITGSSGLNGSYHILTLKYNSSGNLQWVKIFNGGGGDDNALGITIDKHWNVIIVGYTAFGGNVASLAIKYNSNGDSLWTREFREFTNSNNNRYVVTDDSDNVFIAGDTRYNVLLLKYASNGQLAWSTIDPEGELSWGLAIDSNRNTYIVETKSIPSYFSYNKLSKINLNGAIQWT